MNPALRFSIPVRSYQRMTMFESPAHVGPLRGSVDFIVPQGSHVLAAADGVVLDKKSDSTIGGSDPAIEGYGALCQKPRLVSEFGRRFQ